MRGLLARFDRLAANFGLVTPRAAAAFCFALGTALLFANLGQGSLYAWDESLSAMRALNMYADGLSFTVNTYGGPDFNKPPLYYWLAAGMFHLFGPGLFALRLPSVLFALGCLACVYVLGRKMTRSPWAACFALACLAFNPHWLNFARLGKLEAALAFSLIATVLYGCYGKGRHTPAGGAFAGLLLGIGAWVKHPFFVVLLPMLYLHWRYADRAAKPRAPLFWGLGAFAVIGLGWYWASLMLWGMDFWAFYFEYNVAMRVLHGIENHSEGFGFLIRAAFVYGPVAFLCFPLSLPALAAAWRKGDRSAAFPVVLAWLFLLAMSCMAGKRKIYIVAWYPLGAACAAYGAAWATGLVRDRLGRAAETAPGVPASRFSRLAGDKKTLYRFAALACLYAAVMTGVTYSLTPDHSPRETAVYRAAVRALGPGTLLAVHVDTPAVVFFEAGRVADVYIPYHDDPLLDVMFLFKRAEEGESFILVMEDRKTSPGANADLLRQAAARFPGAVAAPVSPSPRSTSSSVAGRFRIYAVKPAGEGKRGASTVPGGNAPREG